MNTTKTLNEEIQYLGNMLFATTADDAPRLLSICKRVSEIAAANPGTVTDQDGTVHLESALPTEAECKDCTDLEHCGSEFCVEKSDPEILGHTLNSYRSAKP